jgi:hypothetical protein
MRTQIGDRNQMKVEPAVRKCYICEAYASDLKRHVKTKRHALLAAIKEEYEVVLMTQSLL